jgi:hypothetical protein
MPIKDLGEMYQDYIERDSYRAFLYTPADVFAGELDLINPELSLIKDGFDLLNFSLSARFFDYNIFEIKDNPFIDFTLDGYYVLFQFGDLSTGNYQERRFIIKNRDSNLQDEQATFSYNAISAEYELQKTPIINWPGIQVKEYKDISSVIPAVEQVNGLANPKLTNDESGVYQRIALQYQPKDSKIFVSRINTKYEIEIPLFQTTVAIENINNMPLNEYYYDSEENEIIV